MTENTWIKDLLKDVLIVIGIVVAFLVLCQLVFGLWTPMYVVSSGSMEPNMNVGDIVLVKGIHRTAIVTQEDALSSDKPRIKFKEPGDVILFRPYGSHQHIPIIHRAMYYVEEGEPMWEGGPAAPHSGYMTKGDNKNTNALLDQQTTISAHQPIKEEWIIGVSQFKIPYVGKIRLFFSRSR
ncbi:MAG: S26 family signal peptidase [Methanimicrococcus sp.]|nr:S26 family signal peptidase [Methanimicrococcus sp.]